MAREPAKDEKPPGTEPQPPAAPPPPPPPPQQQPPPPPPGPVQLAAREREAIDNPEVKPEPIPVEKRAQVGVPVHEGEEIFQAGTEPEPPQRQEKALQSEPAKPEAYQEPQPPPGQQTVGPNVPPPEPGAVPA